MRRMAYGTATGSTGRDEPAIRHTGSRALGVMPYAVDPEAAGRLWSLREKLLDLTSH